jgi:copper(I)-binding protein
MFSFFRALLWLSLAIGAASAAAAPPIVTDPWIRATPPGAVTAAAYLTITSEGADRLVGATTPAAGGVEIHTHVVEAGAERMVRIAELTLAAGEAVRLTPGGLHLMLIDITGPMVPGTKVALSLRFAQAGTVEIDVPVVDTRAQAGATH